MTKKKRENIFKPYRPPIVPSEVRWGWRGCQEGPVIPSEEVRVGKETIFLTFLHDVSIFGCRHLMSTVFPTSPSTCRLDDSGKALIRDWINDSQRNFLRKAFGKSLEGCGVPKRVGRVRQNRFYGWRDRKTWEVSKWSVLFVLGI